MFLFVRFWLHHTLQPNKCKRQHSRKCHKQHWFLWALIKLRFIYAHPWGNASGIAQHYTSCPNNGHKLYVRDTKKCHTSAKQLSATELYNYAKTLYEPKSATSAASAKSTNVWYAWYQSGQSSKSSAKCSASAASQRTIGLHGNYRRHVTKSQEGLSLVCVQSFLGFSYFILFSPYFEKNKSNSYLPPIILYLIVSKKIWFYSHIYIIMILWIYLIFMHITKVRI